MLRANVGLSRKLSKDFNSTGYSINLEGEVTASVSDPQAVIEQVNELFDLAEEALSQQIDRAKSEVAIAGRDSQSVQPASPTSNGHTADENGRQAAKHVRTNGQSEDLPATNKQINYLLSIGKRQQLTTAQLEKRLAEILGRSVGLYDLTKKSAGVVIDALTAEPSQAAASF